MYRGSRKHVLDWTARPSFLEEFNDCLGLGKAVDFGQATLMPRGYSATEEARLESFGPVWLPESPVWSQLTEWWLKHPAGANTPNWDIAIGCRIEDRPGLVLVEAKANWPELGTAGKSSPDPDRANSIENHQRIGDAVEEACAGWRSLDERISITRDSHYQLANRLAFTWKLAQSGVPVVLVYLGFFGDEGIRDVGPPFADDADWQRAFGTYIRDVFPSDLIDRRLDIGPAPAWILSRSWPVLEQSSAREP